MEGDRHIAFPSLERQQALIVAEREAEREEFKRLTQAGGLQRRVARGDCWWPVTTGRHYYNSLNQLVVEIDREPSEEEHNFEYGRPVALFDVDDRDEIHYITTLASVNRVTGDRMLVVVPSDEVATQLSRCRRLGVMISLDETTFRLMLDALQQVRSARGDRLAYLRDLCYGRGLKPQCLTFAPLRFPWLNPTQEHAVNEVLRAEDVAVVHGPPGTGKTTTLVEAICETLRREDQVMVCAQSNMAVDWISERLMERGVSVLRVGNPSRVTDEMLAQTYERQFEDHPDYPQLWSLRRTLREMRNHRRSSAESYHNRATRLRNRINQLEIGIHNAVMSHARAITCTLAGSASRVLQGMHIGTLFIDEAAQAMEAACWIAMTKCRRVILAGDHQQLPPTIKSLEAMRGGLGVTLMERLVATQPTAVTLLGVQYRMNEHIMQFSSNWFYDGKVEAAPMVRYRSILDMDTAIEWVDTADIEGHELWVDHQSGRINPAEAQRTLDVLQAYFEKIGAQRIEQEHIDVGLISPYRAQVRLLRRMLARSAFFKPYRHCISVNTVDGFQGQERDIIVIGMVRANERGQIGFLRDLRRMNVAITRARYKLIIVGHVPTLTRHPFYRQLHQYVTDLQQAD